MVDVVESAAAVVLSGSEEDSVASLVEVVSVGAGGGSSVPAVATVLGASVDIGAGEEVELLPAVVGIGEEEVLLVASVVSSATCTLMVLEQEENRHLLVVGAPRASPTPCTRCR